jgi:formylglycine-generating enzyme required for sulfatase activity
MKLPAILCLLVSVAIFATCVADPNALTLNPDAANATNEVVKIEDPGPTFTNAANMVLLKIPAGFWVGKYEVTQAEYEKVMGSNPSAFQGTNQPVENVTFLDAVDFCKKMTALDFKKKKLPEGYRYTLPTEDEWTNLVADAPLDQAVASLGARLTSPSVVGTRATNSLGLYDIRGNVMEFVLSDESKPYRILKGGSWADFVEVNLRPEFRWYCRPDETTNTFGFRCLLKAK